MQTDGGRHDLRHGNTYSTGSSALVRQRWRGRGAFTSRSDLGRQKRSQFSSHRHFSDKMLRKMFQLTDARSAQDSTPSSRQVSLKKVRCALGRAVFFTHCHPLSLHKTWSLISTFCRSSPLANCVDTAAILAVPTAHSAPQCTPPHAHRTPNTHTHTALLSLCCLLCSRTRTHTHISRMRATPPLRPWTLSSVYSLGLARMEM